MKTSELIRRLQEADPSGDLECCVGGIDILFVAQEPGHYDGSYEVLIRDEKKTPYYDVVGARVTKKGSKVQFHLHSIEDMLVDEPEMPVEFECCKDASCSHRTQVEQWRAEARQINEEVEREMAVRRSPPLSNEQMFPPRVQAVEQRMHVDYSDRFGPYGPYEEDDELKKGPLTRIVSWLLAPKKR